MVLRSGDKLNPLNIVLLFLVLLVLGLLLGYFIRKKGQDGLFELVVAIIATVIVIAVIAVDAINLSSAKTAAIEQGIALVADNAGPYSNSLFVIDGGDCIFRAELKDGQLIVAGSQPVVALTPELVAETCAVGSR